MVLILCQPKAEDKIFCSISTYNRLELVKASARSLAKVDGLEELEVQVFDDVSTEFGYAELRQLYPFAEKITIRPHNLRADGNMFQIFKDFLTSHCQVLFLADSDLLYRADFYSVWRSYWPKTDGVLSVYNTKLHLDNETSSVVGLIEKKSLPALGTFIHRDLIAKLLAQPLGSFQHQFFDWFWSYTFQKWGLKSYSTEQSYVQHIGIATGQNSKINPLNKLHLGHNFTPTNAEDEAFLLKMSSDVLQAIPVNTSLGRLFQFLYLWLKHWVRAAQIAFLIRLKYYTNPALHYPKN